MGQGEESCSVGDVPSQHGADIIELPAPLSGSNLEGYAHDANQASGWSGANAALRSSFDIEPLAASHPYLNLGSIPQTDQAGGPELAPERAFHFSRSVALSCTVALVTTALLNICPPLAVAAEPSRRNKLRDQRLAWERSVKRSGAPQRGGQILGGFVEVSPQPEGPAKVDVDLEKGATYARLKLYKARYLSEEALKDFRRKLRRSKHIRQRPFNYFQRNREVTSAIQLGLFLVLFVAVVRWFLRLAKRNRWGWADWYKPRAPQIGSRVRDRSLGGKEVSVGNQWEWPSWLWGGEKKFKRQTLGGVRKGAGLIETVKHANPLDYEVDLRSEKELRLAKRRQEERRAALERRRQVRPFDFLAETSPSCFDCAPLFAAHLDLDECLALL